ncbi:MAG: hypothetical protein M3Y91_07665, partial [Actinomycetota bacterium]|nr:hypothetical protein [Actinomycetota bacterium]
PAPAATDVPFPPWIGSTSVDRSATIPRPVAVIELLDEGFRILRTQYRTLGPIVAAIATPLAVLSALASRQAFPGKGTSTAFGVSTLGASGGQGGWVPVLVAIALLWPALIAGPVCRVTAASWFGRVENRRSAWRQGMRRVPGQLVAVVAVDVMIAVGALFLFLPAIAVWVLFRLTLPAMIVEGIGPFRAIGRSATLVGRRFWVVLGLSTLALLVGQIVSRLLSLVPTAVGAAFGLHWAYLLLAAASIAVETVTWSWSLIVITLIYLDTRSRREGLDLVVRAGTVSW